MVSPWKPTENTLEKILENLHLSDVQELPITYYLLLTTYDLLLITYHLLLNSTYYMPLTTYDLLLATSYWKP